MRKILGTSCSVVIALAGCAGPGPEVTDGSAPAAPETAPEQVAAEQPAETTPATGATRQFEIADERSAAQIATLLQTRGFEAVWKDWDRAILAP